MTHLTAKTLKDNKTYLTKAHERITSLENELLTCLSKLNDNGNDKQAKPNKALLLEYIRWSLVCISRNNKLEELKREVRRRANKEVYYKEVNHFNMEINSGLNYYSSLLNPNTTDTLNWLHTNYISNPSLDLYISPIKVDGKKPSELIRSFVDIYSFHLDKNGLWFSQDEIEGILKDKGESLLKQMLLESISSLMNSELKFHFKIRNIEQRLIECYSNPNISNLFAITLIVGELIFKNDFKKAAYYLSNATKMAYILGINDVTNSLIVDINNGIFKYSNSYKKLWELLLLFQLILLGEEGVGLPIIKEVKVSSFNHVNNKAICLPTMSRHSQNNISYNIQKFNSMMNYKDKSNDTEMIYYSKCITFHLQLLQSQINNEHLINNVKTINSIEEFYFKKDELIKLLIAIETALKNTPSSYKVYNLLTKNQINEISNFGLPQPDTKPTFGSCGYLLLLNGKLYLADPISHLNPFKHDLLEDWLWEIGLQAADDIYNLFSTLFNKKRKEGYVYHLINSALDCIPTCAFYFNSLANKAFDPNILEQVYLKLKEMLNWFKEDSEKHHIFNNSLMFINIMSQFTKKFNLSPNYSFDL
ncbi:hypothetical protein K502DRAFT_343646 [Neoconidiobolus thromboides FSU 785]|nr:hypothetical protein K502DRAFT_343646 [Neoconidiobolus thromboides FSU 785]